MHLDNTFHSDRAAATVPSGEHAGAIRVVDGRRVDLMRVLTGLRHLTGSPEPGRVFTELAAVCVPALCDEMVIEIDEAGTHRYRIRQPGTPTTRPATDDPVMEVEVGQVTVTDQVVTAATGSIPGGGPDYTAHLTCRWHPGYTPTDTDAALVGVLADHATALVHRERSTGRLADPATAQQVGAALGRAQRVAAATGILMALHHLTATQARQLLTRAGDRTHQSLVDVADTVLHTGALPDQRSTPVTAPAVMTHGAGGPGAPGPIQVRKQTP